MADSYWKVGDGGLIQPASLPPVTGKRPRTEYVDLFSSEDVEGAGGAQHVAENVQDEVDGADKIDAVSHANVGGKSPVVLESLSIPSPFMSVPRFSLVDAELPSLDGDVDSEEAYMKMPPVTGSSSRQRDFHIHVDDGVNLLRDPTSRQTDQFMDQLIGPDEAEEMEGSTVEGLNAQIARNSLATYLLAIGQAKGQEHRRRRFVALSDEYKKAIARLSAQDAELAALRASLNEKELGLAEKQKLEDERKTLYDLWSLRTSEVARLQNEVVEHTAVKTGLEERLDGELAAKVVLQEQLNAEIDKGNKSHREVLRLQGDLEQLDVEARSKQDTYAQTAIKNSQLEDDNLKLRDQLRELKFQMETQAAAFNSQIEAIVQSRKRARIDAQIADLFATARTKFLVLQRANEPDFELEVELQSAKDAFFEQCSILDRDPGSELILADLYDEEEEEDDGEADESSEGEEGNEEDHARAQDPSSSAAQTAKDAP